MALIVSRKESVIATSYCLIKSIITPKSFRFTFVSASYSFECILSFAFKTHPPYRTVLELNSNFFVYRVFLLSSEPKASRTNCSNSDLYSFKHQVLNGVATSKKDSSGKHFTHSRRFSRKIQANKRISQRNLLFIS